jgi:hypothetical protein
LLSLQLDHVKRVSGAWQGLLRMILDAGYGRWRDRSGIVCDRAVKGNSKVRLIADILIVSGLALLAWVVGFVIFAFLTAGPEGPSLQTMLLVATIPAVPVAMVTVAVLIYRRQPRGDAI